MKQNRKVEIVDAIDSRYTSEIERLEESKALMRARKARMRKVQEKDLRTAKLFQLKLQIDRAIEWNDSSNLNGFAAFLSQYISILYKKHSDFAKDINITNVYLSQVLNKHRLPSEEFVLRLMLHSEKTFETITSFNSVCWMRLFLNQKLHKTLSNQTQWRTNLSKEIAVSCALH